MHVTPKVPLLAVPSTQSATALIPSHLQKAVDRLTDRWAEALTWQVRAALAEEMMASFWESVPLATSSETKGLLLVVTALLEQLGETHITCAAQAGLYRFSAHPCWRQAGAKWLAQAGFKTRRRWAMGNPATFAVATRHPDPFACDGLTP